MKLLKGENGKTLLEVSTNELLCLREFIGNDETFARNPEVAVEYKMLAHFYHVLSQHIDVRPRVEPDWSDTEYKPDQYFKGWR